MHEVEHGLKTWKCETKKINFASQAVFDGIFAGVKKWPGNKPTQSCYSVFLPASVIILYLGCGGCELCYQH